jgi:hypothetical protein
VASAGLPGIPAGRTHPLVTGPSAAPKLGAAGDSSTTPSGSAQPNRAALRRLSEQPRPIDDGGHDI